VLRQIITQYGKADRDRVNINLKQTPQMQPADEMAEGGPG
jgi:hypothetical protein